MRLLLPTLALAASFALAPSARAQENPKPPQEPKALPQEPPPPPPPPPPPALPPASQPTTQPAEKPATAEEARTAFDTFEKVDGEVQSVLGRLKMMDEDFNKSRAAALEFRKTIKGAPDEKQKARWAELEKEIELKQAKLVELYESFEGIRPKAIRAFQSAGSTVESALKAKPDDLDLKLVKARLLCSVGKFDEALPLAEAVAKAKPDDKVAQMTHAKTLLGTNRFEAGVAVLQAISKKDPSSREARARLVLALFALNRFSESEEQRKAMGESKDLPFDLQQTLEQWLAAPLIELWTKEAELRKGDETRDDNPRVKLETTKGEVVLELYEDAAPNTVANFVSLVEKGYYDKTLFHRVIPNFMAQGGDPKGTGEGGPGYTIKDELDEKKRRNHFRGGLSMAKTGAPDSGGSQFFLTVVPTPHLNGIHTVFGRVVQGLEIVDRLEVGDEIKKATVQRKRAHDYKPETIKERARERDVVVPMPEEEEHAAPKKEKPPEGKPVTPPKGEGDAPPKKDEGVPTPPK